MRPADLVMLRLQPHAMERRRGLLENLETRANRCFCCGSGVPCATCPRHAASLRRCGVLCLMGGRQHEYWPVKQHTQVPRPSYEKTERNSAEQCSHLLLLRAALQPFLASWLFGAALRGAALASHQAGSRSSARAAAMFGGWCGNSKSCKAAPDV